MSAPLKIGSKVVRKGDRRRRVGKVLRHHPTLPALVVRFPGREPVAYMYQELERA